MGAIGTRTLGGGAPGSTIITSPPPPPPPPAPPNQQKIKAFRRRITSMAGDVQHGSLVANTVKTVTLNAHYSKVTVINRTGTDEVWFTVEGSDPAPETEFNYLCPAAVWAETVEGIEGSAPDAKTVIKLISATAGKYTVMGG